jgi:hypothetical protein
VAKRKIKYMRKKMSSGKSPGELIGRAIMNSRPMRALGDKIRRYDAQPEIERLRTSRKVIMACLVISNCLVLILSSERSQLAPHYANIRQVTTAGSERRPPPVKAFGPIWDSVMADPVVKKRWDSLVRLRPGLRDTIRQLQRMDSVSTR